MATSNPPDQPTEKPAKQMNPNQAESLGPHTIVYIVFFLPISHNEAISLA